MTPSQVRRKLEKLRIKEDKLKLEFKTLRDICGHVNYTKKAGGNSGNYDPSSDYYWYDWSCQDCGRTFTTEQSDVKFGETMKEYEQRMNVGLA